MVYADNAATTKLDLEALESMKKFLVEEYGNPSQPYSFSRVTKTAVSEARITIAECIGAKPKEIFFTSGGTESDNWALKGYAKGHSKKDFIISPIEHHAVLNAAEALSREGYRILYLDVTREGEVLPSFLNNIITDQTAMVSVMFANNEIGSVQPIKALAQIAHSHGAVFHTDAVQTVGHIPVDVEMLGVDMLSASAHKFNGPRGVGFLYIREGTEVYPMIDGGNQENGLRAGTENVASIVGMAVALKKNCASIENEGKRLLKLEEELISGLTQKRLQFIRNGAENHLPGNVSLSFKNSDGEMILHRLDLMGICVSTGSACDSKNTQLSHVIKAINVPEEYATGTIRISFGKDNSIEDVKKIVEALARILLFDSRS